MADPIYLPTTPDILGQLGQATRVAGGIQNIRASQASIQLAQRQQQMAEQQAIAEQIEREKTAKVKALQNKYTTLSDIAKEQGKAGDFEGMINTYTAINANLREQGLGYQYDTDNIRRDPGNILQKMKVVDNLRKSGNEVAAREAEAIFLPQFNKTAEAEEKIVQEEVKEGVARTGRRQRAAGIPFGTDLAKERFVETGQIAAPPAPKIEIRDVTVGEGKIQTTVFKDGVEVRKLGAPILKHKPTAGKPFKEKQIRFFKVDNQGIPKGMKALSEVDGKVSIDKFNELLENGYIPESQLKRQQQPFVLQFGGGTPEMADEGDQGEMAAEGEVGLGAPSFEEYKSDLTTNPANLINGKLRWDDEQLRGFYREDFGVEP